VAVKVRARRWAVGSLSCSWQYIDISSGDVWISPQSKYTASSCQFAMPGPGRMNASMKVGSKLSPSRLDMITISFTTDPACQLGVGERSCTNRDGNIS
jgi:hypothetical protein